MVNDVPTIESLTKFINSLTLIFPTYQAKKGLPWLAIKAFLVQ